MLKKFLVNGVEKTDDLKPITVLSEELKNEYPQVRLMSIKKLSTIASVLGIEKTRTELLPFILKNALDDEEEILIALAEELKLFVSYIGGNEYAFSLLDIFEVLLSTEEYKIREKAIESIQCIVKDMPKEHFIQHFYPTITKLINSVNFNSRSSSSYLIPLAYSHANDSIKEQLREDYLHLSEDFAVSVRVAAAENLQYFAKQVEKEYLKDIVRIFQGFINDKEETVRAQCINTILALTEVLSPEETIEIILPSIRLVVTDLCWKVRSSITVKFMDIYKLMGDQVKIEMNEYYISLLQDKEPEVQTISLSILNEFCSLVQSEYIVSVVLPVIQDLTSNIDTKVRAMVARNSMGLCTYIGKENSLNHLLGMLTKLLKDENAEVRLNSLSNLDTLNRVIGMELLTQSLLPALVELAEDTQWRIRIAIINYIPVLVGQLGVEFFDEKLCDLCISWLEDPVFAIREVAAQNFKRLIEIFGVEWGQNNVIPIILNLHSHENYLNRLTTLKTINQLLSVLGTEVIDSTILPIVVRMASDPVPNIRFNVCKTLQLISQKSSEQSINNRIKPTLNRLRTDQDNDVIYFANQALQNFPPS